MRFNRTLLPYIVFGLVTFSSIGLSAQINSIGQPDIKNYKKNDYLGGTQNWDIDQDLNGNMYFANNNGLLQFDGSFWNLFKINHSINVRSVKVDNQTGRIYVGGYGEFGYFKSNDKGTLIYHSLLDEMGLTTEDIPEYIWKIHLLDNEVIFQAFTGAYIYKNNHISNIKAPSKFQFSYKVDQTLYIQDLSKGILKYSNGQLIPLKGSTLLNNLEVWGIFPLNKTSLLFATLENGLFVYEHETMKPWKTKANDFISNNGSLGGALIDQNTIALNSVLDGLIIINSQGDIMKHLDAKNGLQNNTVLNSFIDNKKNLWLGLDNGISYANINSPFSYLGPTFNLSTVYASVIHKGYLYTATNQGVFYHDLNSSFIDDHFSLVEGTTGQAWNIQVIGNELVCASNNGATIIKDNSLLKTLDSKGYYGFREIPSRPNYVIASHYDGYALFHIGEDGLEYKWDITGTQTSATIFEIDMDYLWMKRDDKLYQMTLSENLKEFVSVKTIQNLNPYNTPFNSLNKINNKIYFESQNVFYTYLKDSNSFIEDSTITEIFKDCPPINFIKQDRLENLWYISGESLGLLLRKTDQPGYHHLETVFANLTGDLVENFISINPLDNQNIFIGSTDGLVNFNPQSLHIIQYKPEVFIRNFTTKEDTIIQGNFSSYQKDISLPYTSNNVKFTFSSPEFSSPEKIDYALKLEPFDSDWNSWSNLPMKEYTNLREGNYTMKVKAKNSYGNVSDIGTFNFSVSPPWYRHYLAYTGYVLFLIGLLYIIATITKVRLRKQEYYKTVEQRKTYLEKESKIRQEQYQLEKEIEKLNREKLQTELIAKDKELVNNSLQVAKKNKTLNGIIQKLKKMEMEAADDNIKNQFTSLKNSITKKIKSDNSWKDLEKHIKNVHFEFLKRLKEKHPTITPRELDLSTYLLMNMSTKEIAEVMNISNKGVELARYRLRKKLGLKRKQNLTGYLMNI